MHVTQQLPYNKNTPKSAITQHITNLRQGLQLFQKVVEIQCLTHHHHQIQLHDVPCDKTQHVTDQLAMTAY